MYVRVCVYCTYVGSAGWRRWQSGNRWWGSPAGRWLFPSSSSVVERYPPGPEKTIFHITLHRCSHTHTHTKQSQKYQLSSIWVKDKMKMTRYDDLQVSSFISKWLRGVWCRFYWHSWSPRLARGQLILLPTAQPLVCSSAASASCSPLLANEESLQLCLIAGVVLRLQRRHNRQHNELLSSHSPADGRWLISAIRNTCTAKKSTGHTKHFNRTRAGGGNQVAPWRLPSRHTLNAPNLESFFWGSLLCDFTVWHKHTASSSPLPHCVHYKATGADRFSRKNAAAG